MDGNPGSDTAESARRYKHGRLAKYATLWLLPALIFVALLIRWPPDTKPSWTDVILAVATIAYVVVTFCQWRALRDTLDETQRSNTLTLRAWILVEKIELTKKLTAVDPSSFIDRPIRVTVKNYGPLPALRVTRTYDIKPTIGRAPLMSHTPGNLVIAPGDTHDFDLPVDDIPPERLAEIEVGDSTLMVATRFTYTDPRKTDGDSSNCWSYDPGITSPPGEPVVFGRAPRFIERPISEEFGFGVR